MMWRPYRIRFLDYQYRQAYLDLFWRALAGRSDLLLEVLDATSGSSPSTQYARSAFLDGLLAYEYADLHLGEEEAFLAEEDGFCRGISNVYGCYEGGDADQRISRYVSLCPPISALVYVNAAPDLAFRRRKTRDTGYLSLWARAGKTEESVLASYRRLLEVAELGNCLLRARGTQIIELDTSSNDLRSTIDECVAKLRSVGFQL